MSTLIIFCATYLIAAPVGVLLIYATRKGWVFARALALELVLALPLVYILARIAGMLYQHEQPFAVGNFEPLIPHVVDNSFPSDHMAAASVLATAASLRHTLLGISLWIFAALIGAGRMLAGLHWPLDIVVAVGLGVCAVALVRRALRYFA